MTQTAEIHECSRYRCLFFHEKALNDLFLISCGLEQCLPGKRIWFKQRAGYHVHIVLSGEGTFSADGKEQRVGKGQMFVCKPDENTWYRADEQNPWRYCWMTFGGNLESQFCSDMGFTEGVNCLNSYIDTDEYLEVVTRMLDRPELDLSSDLFRTGLMLEFMGLVVRSNDLVSEEQDKSMVHSPDRYVQLAIDYIRSNYQTTKVNDIASAIGIHRSYLTSIFKNRMGVSPQQYLLQYRLGQGAELLEHTSYSIQEIARSVGYDDPLTFSKMFKRMYGYSPKYYRDRAKKE